MTDAINNPVKRQYNRREVHTADMPIAQKPDIDLNDDIQHGESLVQVAADITANEDYMKALHFMEEPVTVRIEENSRSDFPETHVPCAVNGKGAEVWMNNQWIAMTWLPVNAMMTIKRKYVEVLARAKSDSIRTKHDDATVERPQNRVERRSSSNYPLSIIEDKNPRGHEWLSRIMIGH